MIPRQRALRWVCTILLAWPSYGSIAQTNVWVQSGVAVPMTAFARNSGGDLYVVGSGGFFASTDGGHSWTQRTLPTLPNGYPILSIGVDGSDNVYLGTFYKGVYRSTDAGQSWVQTSAGPGNVSTFLPVSGHGLYVSTYNWGIFRSTDAGVTWTPLNNGLRTTDVCNDIIAGPGGTLLTGTSVAGVFRSTDHGSTWVPSSGGLTSLYVLRLFVDPGGRIYAGTDDGKVFASNDTGKTWVSAGRGILGSRVSSFAALPGNEVFALSQGGMHRSVNGGGVWQQVNNGLQSQSLASVITNASQEVLVATGSGVFRRNQFLTTAPSPVMLVSPPNAATHIPVSSTLTWQSDGTAQSYSLQIARDTTFSQIAVDQGSIAAASFQAENLDKATEYFWHVNGSNIEGTGGWSDTWRFTTAFPSLYPPQLAFPGDGAADIAVNPTLGWRGVELAVSYIVQIAPDSGFSSVVFEQPGVADTAIRASGLQFGTRYYWRVRAVRSDSTSEWSAVWKFNTGASVPPSHFPLAIGNSWTVASIAFSVVQSHTVKKVEKDSILSDGREYAAIRDYFRPAGEQVWTPGSWEYLRLDGSRLYGFPDSLIVDFDSTVGSCVTGGCMISDYQGTWLDRPARIVALSSNGYDYWSYADSLGFASIYLDWYGYHSAYTIGAIVDGVEYGSVLAVHPSPSPSRVPEGYVLHQNYPNPFNPTTTIAYTVGGVRRHLPAGQAGESGVSMVHLAVYDLLGREVAVLVNERKAPGRYEVTFDGSRLASGVYVYRLQAGTFVETKKLILLR